MKNQSKDTSESFIAILVGVFAIFMIKSIFENDNSKIVSKKGRYLLSDDKKMEEINNKISISEQNNTHKEIFI